MTDPVVHSGESCDGRSRESTRPCQSIWMDHWLQKSCDASAQVIKDVGNDENIRDIKHQRGMSQTEIVSSISGSRKQFGEIETGTIRIMNESVREQNLRNEEQGSKSFLVAGACRSGQSSSALQKEPGTNGVKASTPLMDGNFDIGKVNLAMTISCIPSVAAAEISSGEFHSQPESELQKPMEQVKTHAFFRKDRIAVSSDILPYRSGHGSNRFESGLRAVSSFMEAPFLSSKDCSPCDNLKISETDDSNDVSHLKYFVGRQSTRNHSNSGNSLTPYFRRNVLSLLPDDPSTSDHRLPEFGEEHLKLQSFSCFKPSQFPHQCNSPELTRSEKLHHGYYSLQKLRHSIHDVETMRIRDSVDSVVGLSGAFPRFSQTSRSLLITKKTDFSLGKEKEVIANFGVASDVDGNAFDLHSPSPSFGNGQQGVKIMSLGSSTDSEGKENIEDVKASKVILKNESSAETDIMDMDAFMEKHCVNSPLVNKGIEKDLRPSQFPVNPSGIKIGCKHVNTKAPDINLEFCDLSAGGNSKDAVEPDSSKTQSLDMDLLLGHAEQTNDSIPDPCPDSSRDLDPTERWIKRLKLPALGSQGLGMRISNLEDFSHKKVHKPFNTTTSEPEEGNCHGKEPTRPGKSTTLLGNMESSSADTAKKGRDLLLSQSWIRRWLCNQAGSQQKETEALLLCEPQSSTLASDEFEKKHFPSIAAMAMLGKSMSGFQPCQIERRGSFVFWETKEV